MPDSATRIERVLSKVCEALRAQTEAMRRQTEVMEQVVESNRELAEAIREQDGSDSDDRAFVDLGRRDTADDGGDGRTDVPETM